MGVKDWFRGGARGKEQEPQGHTIDDLIILERYGEAADRLRTKLKDNPQDLHAHLKLAEVHTQLREFGKAVDEYAFVADEYAQDGFYDKGIALLAKAAKLAPLDESIRFKIGRLQREKSMEHLRGMALEGLRQAGNQQAGTTALELQRLWRTLAGSSLVQRLPGDQLKRFFGATEFFRCEAATVLVEEASQEPFLLLLVRGVVEAFIEPEPGKSLLVRTFSSGDVVGEGVLLERGVWPAAYRATEPVTALKLTRAGLEKTLVGNPDPRGFLDALREQRNDRDVAATVRRLRSGG
ncbi:MAG TPA: cyclic nucleotide-binding domain-containing protein [Thermoanaerobaculia bacterium]|nr:cyclic nucleotide-binding domain-containing protein [Thermoanaerobaculia bacterium]